MESESFFHRYLAVDVANGTSRNRGTPVPRLDATSSRLLILSLMPHLSTNQPPHLSSSSCPRPKDRTFRALDCGAGIGRVTSTVLLPLFDTVDLVEPVPSFVEQAKRDAESGKGGWKYVTHGGGSTIEKEKGKGKKVRIWRAGLQHFDPSKPSTPIPSTSSPNPTVELYATIGQDTSSHEFPNPQESLDPVQQGYDLVMIQWCIGHLSDVQLSEFLQRSRKALKRDEDGKTTGFIIVKENVCKDEEKDGRLFDEDDSSITR